MSVSLLRGVEGRRFLEDVLASSQTLQGLADLLSRVEGLGLLEDVQASSQTFQGLTGLLADLLGLGRSASGGQASGDALREVNIQGASPCVMDTGERTVACGANHY